MRKWSDADIETWAHELIESGELDLSFCDYGPSDMQEPLQYFRLWKPTQDISVWKIAIELGGILRMLGLQPVCQITEWITLKESYEAEINLYENLGEDQLKAFFLKAFDHCGVSEDFPDVLEVSSDKGNLSIAVLESRGDPLQFSFGSMHVIEIRAQQDFFKSRGKTSLKRMLPLATSICNVLDPVIAYYYDSWLHLLHQEFGRRQARSLANRRRFSPQTEVEEIFRHPILDTLLDPLPPLYLDCEIDLLSVPERIWWINYWPSRIIKTLGLKNIETAGFHQIIRLKDCEGLILVATPTLLDVRKKSHLTKITSIVQNLGLKEAQERYLL